MKTIAACSVDHTWPQDKNRERVPNSIYWDECIECHQPIPLIKPGRELIRIRPLTAHEKRERDRLKSQRANNYRNNRKRSARALEFIEEQLQLIKDRKYVMP